ncbi:hypothetical protein BKA70DRAFT_53146 [Coprinopsis sp. MPI-PUGE-AT-0042]|nr:hypothetical protein BKA70DRAFT_53146 [Coprinopsis sp. MPI-PUGE-AT-0042]
MENSAVESAMDTLLLNKSQTMYAAYQQGGGWEGWVQVEIAFALTQHGDVKRERHHTYPENQDVRAGIWLNLNRRGLFQILEVKCWDQLQALEPDLFIMALREDIEHILTLDGLLSTSAWVMVLVIDPVAKAFIKMAMKEMRRREGGTGDFIDQVTEVAYPVDDPDIFDSIYLLTFLKSVN